MSYHLTKHRRHVASGVGYQLTLVSSFGIMVLNSRTSLKIDLTTEDTVLKFADIHLSYCLQ